jgi:diguanylate cyclase (GGDEF)-like protein/PAS domain S-box-containing protein
MPDYGPAATVYWWTLVLVGAAVIAGSAFSLAQASPRVWVEVAVGVAISMLAGSFPVRIRNSNNSFAAGEIFVFLLLLIHGPAAAALAAAGEAAISAWRTSRRWTSRIVSPAMSAIAFGGCGLALHAAIEQLGGIGAINPGLLVLGAMACALLSFAVNTTMISAVPRLKRGERPRLSDLLGIFGWVGVAFAGSGAVAVLLFLAFRASGMTVLLAMLPVLALMVATLHYVFRQQEAADAAMKASAEAAARERELAERHVRELEASERRFHSAFTHASIGMALLSFDGDIVQANPALHALLGVAPDSLPGRSFPALALPEDRGALERELGLATGPGGHEFEGFALELRCRHAGGDAVWIAAHCSFFSEPGSAAPCLILQVQDITARRRAEAGLQHIAFHDSLTGLPNRRRFHDLLAEAVAKDNALPKAGDSAFAVMFLDFDRFKLINDSLGHNAGDEFLIQVSQRIQASLRPCDVVARLGGDEFAVLIRALAHEREAVALAERLMEVMRQPFFVGGTELISSASIGITFSALGYTHPDQVLRDADIAMYKAKGAGKARYALFDASLHTEVANRLRLEGDLRHAIDAGRLTVAYQPVFDLAHGDKGRILGFEALVRWPHPQDGSIPPGEFLPIAEDAGLMLKLTDFVLHCACRQLRQWQQRFGLPGLSINVNVSGQDLAHPSFVARVTRALVEAGLKPQSLCLELTENILMSRVEGALPLLHELKRLGVALAVDDFGTGYSSLSHLSKLPIDSLKIDRSFVARLALPDGGAGQGQQDAAVVQSIVLLGRSLGKSIVAEGIETEAQRQVLLALNCTRGQGYLVGRPMPAAHWDALLAAGAAAPLCHAIAAGDGREPAEDGVTAKPATV